MSVKISLTITETEGEKPEFEINADWQTKIADFNITATQADGTTIVIPSANFNTP